MKNEHLIPGRIYRMKDGDFAEFSRIGGTGLAIFHPHGEPDMQSSWAISAALVDRQATQDEAVAYVNKCKYGYDPEN